MQSATPVRRRTAAPPDVRQERRTLSHSPPSITVFALVWCFTNATLFARPANKAIQVLGSAAYGTEFPADFAYFSARPYRQRSCDSCWARFNRYLQRSARSGMRDPAPADHPGHG